MTTRPRILAIAADYPSVRSPARGTFVHVLMREWTRLGAQPVVIAPEPILGRKRGVMHGSLPRDELRDGVQVHRPRYFSFSNRILPFGFSIYPWTVSLFARSAARIHIESGPAVCYGHFLYPAGLTALGLAARYGVPAAVALGESSFDHYERHFGVDRVRKDLGRFSRIVAVSDQIAETCKARYLVRPDRIRVFPNGVDGTVFRPFDRREVRRQLGLPEGPRIVAFVGHMVERKGPTQVMEAISGLSNLGAVFLGEGPLRPQGDQVLFAGTVSHGDVPRWLSAADVFVLPSFAEGWSNAILEALACGLPVVASDRPFNSWLRGSQAAVLVEPTAVSEIRAGIKAFLDDPQRAQLAGKQAVALAARFSSRARAAGILEWLLP